MTLKRRDFLAGLGASAALAPFVPYLNRRAEAAGFPRRLLLILTGCGSVASEYFPIGNEAAYTFKAGSITEPLMPFRSKLIFPRNMRRVRNGPGGHESAIVPLWTASSRNPGQPYGGYAKNPSVDQIIAKGMAAPTAFPSLEFGVQSDAAGDNSKILSVMCYSGNDQPIQAEPSPYRMLDRLMLGSARSPTGIGPADLDRLRARRKSAIDLVGAELRALSAKIGRDDRIKLDQHLEGLSAIEKRLFRAPDAVSSAACAAPTMQMGIDLKANASFPELLAIQNSLAVAALACDRTRVASLQWSRALSTVRHNWVGVSTDHHTLSHNTSPDAFKKKVQIERWFMTQMADLLGKLDAVPEGDGTLLDNTMVIYANELTNGAIHSVTPVITLVAGRGGGKLKTGRAVDLPSYDFSQLLVTACHVMGVTSVNKIGDLGSTGPIPTLLA